MRRPRRRSFSPAHTVAEVMFGVGALPEGKRKDSLVATLESVLALFAARGPLIRYRRGTSLRRSRDQRALGGGKAFPRRTAISPRSPQRAGSPWASRDASAFTSAGLTVIDPWIAANSERSI